MLRDEANHRDLQAREGLFLTFGCDLGFFESQLLGTVRATGAAVTVIADPKVYEPDPRSVRAAGVHYCIGLADMPGIFHPKLSVVVGAERAAIAIGSGNLSVGGWHLNDEVLTVVTGDREAGCAPIVRQVSNWILNLSASSTIQLGRSARAALERTAGQLRSLCDTSPQLPQGPYLVGNLDTSILDQLPRSPIDELRLFAPFHDLSGQALDQLVSALAPKTVTIAIQERFTVIAPHALLAVAERRQVDLRFEQTEGDSYRHGKIIEARNQGDVLWSLAGSPNLSNQALLRSVDDGGNCELAVLDHHGKALYPPTTGPIGVEDLITVRTGPPSGEEEPAQRPFRDDLLEAALVDDTIELTFARPFTAERRVELSPYRVDPDNFAAGSTLAPGRQEYTIPAEPTWDYPLRLRVCIQDQVGPIHFVTRPDQVALRVSGRGGVRTPAIDPDDIFADDRQAREWLSAVTQLALDAQRRGISAARVGGGIKVNDPTASSAHGGATWDDPAAWRVYIDEAAQRLGESMLSFALGGLPRIALTTSHGPAAWEDDFAKRTDEVTEDVVPEEPEDGLGVDTDADDPDVTPHSFGSADRQRYRRWLADLVNPPGSIPAIDRAVRARLMLRATRMKLWEPGIKAGWFELLLAAVLALPGDDIPPDYEPHACALAQVMLYELADAAREIGASRDIEHHSPMSVYLDTEGRLADLLHPVDRGLMETYANTLRIKGAIRPDPDLIAQHAAGAIADDAIDQSIRRLRLLHPQLHVSRVGTDRIGVLTPEGNPLPAAGRCLDALNGNAAAFARSSNGRRAFAARAGMTMVTAVTVGLGIRFRSYTLSPWVSPTRVAEREGNPEEGVHAAETPRLGAPGRLGAGVLARLPLDISEVEEFLRADTA